MIPGMIRCSAVQLRQSESGANRADFTYFNAAVGRIAKPQFSLGGMAQVNNSSFSHNSATGLAFSAGGGICSFDGGTLTVSNSTFSDNQAGYDQAGQPSSGRGDGGGISVSGVQ